MSRKPSRAPTNIYIDCLGTGWPIPKLDEMLTDKDVLLIVTTGANIGLLSDGTWSPGRVWSWAGTRYRRQEVAALALVLITRFFDTAGAHHLGRRPCR